MPSLLKMACLEAAIGDGQVGVASARCVRPQVFRAERQVPRAAFTIGRIEAKG